MQNTSKFGVVTATIAAIIGLMSSVRAEDRSLPYDSGVTASAFGVRVGVDYDLKEQGDDIIFCIKFSTPVAGERRCVNVTAGVNPAVGKCYQVMTEIPVMMPPLKSLWAESCSSGLGHCREGYKWVSVSLIAKAGFHGGIPTQNATLMSGDWYRTRQRC